MSKRTSVVPSHRFRRPYDDHVSVLEFNSEPSMTKQSDAEACDINNILRKYTKTGVLTHVVERQPRFGDFSSASDYQEAMNLVIASNDAFDALPSDVRRYFDNDPSKYLSFFENADNLDEAIRLGLVERPANYGVGSAPSPSEPRSSGDGLGATPPAPASAGAS